MKKYLVEFTYIDGSKEQVSFETDNIEWTIDQFSRNRTVSAHIILNEDTSSSKQMLFG